MDIQESVAAEWRGTDGNRFSSKWESRRITQSLICYYGRSSLSRKVAIEDCLKEKYLLSTSNLSHEISISLRRAGWMQEWEGGVNSTWADRCVMKTGFTIRHFFFFLPQLTGKRITSSVISRPFLLFGVTCVPWNSKFPNFHSFCLVRRERISF